MSKIYRHYEPNKYDQAPRGTECWVKMHESERDIVHYKVYMQTNKHEDKPAWEYLRMEYVP